jgi:transposase
VTTESKILRGAPESRRAGAAARTNRERVGDKRIFGLQTQRGLRFSLQRLRAPDAMAVLEHQGMPAVWRRSIIEALEVIDMLDARITPLNQELRPLARSDRVVLLDTIPGIGDLLGLTLASEIGDIARFGSPRKLIGYAGLAPRSTSPVTARAPALCPRPGPGRCAGPPSKRPNRRGRRPTRGTGSIPTSPSAPARTRPRPRSRARS